MNKQPKFMTFIDKATPIWFQWLGWFLAVGVIGYIAEKTEVLSINIIYGISYVFFFLYITNAISNIMDSSVFKSETVNKYATFIIAILIMSLSTIALHQTLKVLVSNG